MDVAATEPGLCPGCEDPGPVATRCPRGVCSRRALHFVPPEYVGPAAPDPLIGRMVDSYLVVKLLGAGGFGKVYLALQLPILMRAAVKILHRGGDDAAEQRRVAAKFLAEARALGTLSHPNIVRLLQFGAFDDTAYLAMEFVEGGTTLRDLVQRRAAARDPLSHAEVGVILRQLLDALEAAHARQIVHRDVKPENIMVQSLPGHPLFVRVLDFGLAKFVSEQTETSSAIGTPVYMAPEQVLRRHIGPWTDVYAVGALAFELFTGRRPHQGETVHEIFARKLDSAVDPLAEAGDLGLPEPAAAFFRHALAFDHTARIQDVPACRAELELALRALVARDADLERARAVTFAPEPEPARASVPLPLPVVVESTPTRLEPAAEMAALAPLRAPPASTDTVDRGGASARRRRSARTLLLAAVAVAVLALAVVLVVVLTRGGGDDGPLARRLPDGVRAYYRIDDVAHCASAWSTAPASRGPRRCGASSTRGSAAAWRRWPRSSASAPTSCGTSPSTPTRSSWRASRAARTRWPCCGSPTPGWRGACSSRSGPPRSATIAMSPRARSRSRSSTTRSWSAPPTASSRSCTRAAARWWTATSSAPRATRWTRGRRLLLRATAADAVPAHAAHGVDRPRHARRRRLQPRGGAARGLAAARLPGAVIAREAAARGHAEDHAARLERELRRRGQAAPEPRQVARRPARAGRGSGA
ncbi:MAG: serine/threonine-protein kinase [Myxococcota bacterium]